MATSKVEICNSALTKIGEDLIVSLSDSSNRAKACNAVYDTQRKNLLFSHPWNFAIDRKALGQTANTPVFGYDNEFLIPSDVLRILETDITYIDDDYQVETNSDGNRVVVTNASTLKIKYLKNVTDVALFSEGFAESLAYMIAKNIVYRLTQSTTLLQQISAEAQAFVAQARSFDAQEGGQLRQVEASEWFDARF